ncbi:hypothetical protein [Nocardia suismassiliense]|uniref:hypothetical protein n=1 Tax=Nocardia suismassiliense TaxID=2077092 RepID=UPI00131EE26A|nr:hypothetical protein [Nocardia suismassiliense]
MTSDEKISVPGACIVTIDIDASVALDPGGYVAFVSGSVICAPSGIGYVTVQVDQMLGLTCAFGNGCSDGITFNGSPHHWSVLVITDGEPFQEYSEGQAFAELRDERHRPIATETKSVAFH